MRPEHRSLRQALTFPGWLDVVGVLFFVLGVPYTCALELFVVLPTYNLSALSLVLNFLLGVWLALQTLTQLTKVILADTRPPMIISENDCSLCRRPQAAGTYHCPRCDRCVLERDHHCWLSGCCIGRSNLRPFIIMLCAATSAGLYATAFNWRFYGTVLWPTGRPGCFWFFLCFCAPHVLLLTGYLSLFEFFVAANLSIGTTTSLILCCLLIRQLCQLRQGQTNYEWRKNITAPLERNRGSLMENLKRTFEDRPAWDLLWPFW